MTEVGWEKSEDRSQNWIAEFRKKETHRAERIGQSVLNSILGICYSKNRNVKQFFMAA